MRYRLGWMLAAAAGSLGGCASNQSQAQPEGKVTPQMRSGSAELRTYRIEDWTAPDDRTLIVNGANRTLYEAQFKGRCVGLRLVDTVAFVIQGTPEIDHYSAVVLPNGTRCAFKSLTRLETPPAVSKPTSH